MPNDTASSCTDKLNKLQFYCDCCGACCSHLEQFAGLFDDLDRGDGVCRFYDPQSKLCSIYEKRPLKCRVEEGYKAFFAGAVSYEEYLAGTYKACRALKALPAKILT